MIRKSLLLIAGLWLMLPTVAHAQGATLIREHFDWKALTFNSGKGQVCYVVSQAKQKRPSNLDHGDVVFFVTHRTEDSVRGEPYFKVGYAFKPSSSVNVNVDGVRFSMFTKEDGAWLANAETEVALVEAMKKGSRMVVEAVSKRGNKTRYVYSLSGITAAMKDIDNSCKI